MRRAYKDAEIEKALQLRAKFKYSFAKLQELTGIPATTIRNWCQNDYPGTRWDTLLVTNKRRREELKQSEKSTVDSLGNIDKNISKILASVIYWCEGSKYPSTNKLTFTNSDPDLAKLFINLLRKSFGLDESKLRVHLQAHDNHNIDEIKKYWSRLLNIPESQFIKPTITHANGGKHRKNYFGTCTIRYGDFKILLKLTGIYENLAKKLT